MWLRRIREWWRTCSIGFQRIDFEGRRVFTLSLFGAEINWSGCWGSSESGSFRLRFFLDAIDVGFGAEVDGLAIKGGGGHAAVVELVGGDDFQFWAGFDDEGFAFFVSQVEVAIGEDGGG